MCLRSSFELVSRTCSRELSELCAREIFQASFQLERFKIGARIRRKFAGPARSLPACLPALDRWLVQVYEASANLDREAAARLASNV